MSLRTVRSVPASHPVTAGPVSMSFPSTNVKSTSLILNQGRVKETLMLKVGQSTFSGSKCPEINLEICDNKYSNKLNGNFEEDVYLEAHKNIVFISK